MKKRNTTLITAILLFYACETKINEVETIVCDFSSPTHLFQCEWIENITFTSLDTACLIGAESELLLAGDNLFVKHGPYYDIRIDRFHTKGTYLNQIGQHGRGPGEYGDLSDWFLHDNNLIGIHGYGTKKILLYKLSGSLEREVNYEVNAFMVHSDGNHFWALKPPFADSLRLVYLSESGSTLKSMHKSEKTYPVSADLWRPFFRTNNKLYIGMPYNNTLFLSKNDTVIPSFMIDAGKYAIPQEFYNDPFEVYETIMQDGYAFVYNFLESNDYLVLQMLIQQNDFCGMVWGVKNKKINHWFWSKMEIWPPGRNNEFYAADITTDNRLVVLIYPDELKKQRPLMKNVINSNVLDYLNEDDNPVLVEIRFK